MSGDDRAIARIEAELAKLGAELSPPAGWQARVLAEVAARPRRRWWWLAIPAVAAAVIIVLWVVQPSRSSRSSRETPEGAIAMASDGARVQLAFAIVSASEMGVTSAVEHEARVVRGHSAKINDVITVTATGGGPHHAVWIYRGDHTLVIACPGAAGCNSTSDAETATVKLELAGSYTLVALSSRMPLPTPTSSYDQSMAAAVQAGAERDSKSLSVR
ncbi:MAG TPA: hypothetical protein VN253_14815 [Kofleriaceae bacterium]|nr:hypothetical protein [Kofleriaceae bacterium]